MLELLRADADSWSHDHVESRLEVTFLEKRQDETSTSICWLIDICIASRRSLQRGMCCIYGWVLSIATLAGREANEQEQ